MSRTLLLLLSPAILALSAGAQSINVDFGPDDSPVRSPPPAYGGSANAPGVWNRVGSTTVTNLRRWDGAPTGVSLSTTYDVPACNGLFHFTDVSGTTGEDEALLDDRYSVAYTPVFWTFQGLEPGEYVVDTIIVDQSSCLTGVLYAGVFGSPDPEQYVGGGWNGSYVQSDPNGAFSFDMNFTRHRTTVTDGMIHVSVGIATSFADYPRISGIQIVAVDGGFTGTFLCYGDGAGAACPCANGGEPGFGCQNSAGTGGAFLHAKGATRPDRVVLHASDETPMALTIFLQGSATVGPFAFGDGLRCAGGILKRLYVKSASGGTAAAPGAGDVPITMRSAALGDPISPGERRTYQTYYRDAIPTFCSAPQGNTFNASNAVEVLW